jgi:hypothetical protein
VVGERPYIRRGKKEFNASEGYEAGTVTEWTVLGL